MFDPRPWLPQDGCVLAMPFVTLRRFPDLATMLLPWQITPLETGFLRADGFAGWGQKLPARLAARAAKARRKPFWTLEDGFLRSVGLGKAHCPSVSLIVDDLGVHIDASRPSRLETILVGDDLSFYHADADALAQKISRHRLTKYNHLPDRPAGIAAGRGRRLLLVDQVAGDYSIAGAMASAASFRAMLAAALAMPDARVIIRAHPDVTAGRARGFFGGLADDSRIGYCDAAVSPHAVLDDIDEVWTISSQLGFDALLRGKPVRCFGVPFYAGYGLTQDEPATQGAAQALARRRQALATRKKPLALPDLVAAALLRYALYFDPVRGCRTDADQAIARLIAWRSHAQAWRGVTFCARMSWHKRAVLRAYCAPPGGAVRFSRMRQKPDRIAVWGTRGEALLGNGSPGVPVLRVEDGFIRSVGLGSAKTFPLSLCFDASGQYYDATRPSDLETLLETMDFSPQQLERARNLREALVAAGISKYNLAQRAGGPAPAVAAGLLKIVVFGQVPDDESLRLGLGPTITNLGFLAKVRASRPDAFIVFKEHPDLIIGKRKGKTDMRQARSLANEVSVGGDAMAWIDFADEVHVRTSLAGFEALLRHKTVVCHAAPFYSGWGLTQDHVAISRRSRKRSLDELVAAALIVHPAYVHPRLHVPMEAEDALALVVAMRHASLGRAAVQKSAGPASR